MYPATMRPFWSGLGACSRRPAQGFRLRLQDLDFTYPDSFTAMAFGPQFGLPLKPRPYHQHVFRLPQLQEVVAQYGLPTVL